MGPRDRVHDSAILDALDAMVPELFAGDVWRITRKGRDPLRGGAANGRFSPPGEFEVLYTSLKREGAEAEIGYRMSLEPIWPSRLEHEVHQLELEMQRSLRFADITSLGPLGVDVDAYETFDYEKTQAIASAAHFLEFDGLLVPSARYDCSNAVVFMDRLVGGGVAVVNTESIDWSAWKNARAGC